MPLYRELFLFGALIVNLSLGFLVYFKTRFRRKESLVFSILAWACSVWIFSGFMTYLHKGDPTIVFWAKMSFSSAAVIAYAFLAFAILFPGDRIPLKHKHLLLLALPPVFFIVLSLGTGHIVFSLGSGKKMFNYGKVQPFYTLFILTYFLSGFVFFFRSYRRSAGLERLQTKYVLLSMFVTVTLGVLANQILPMSGNSSFTWLGPTSTVVLVGGTTYSIIRHRLMDISFVLTKGTSFLLLFLPSAFLLIGTQRLFFHQVSYYFSGMVLLIVFVLTFFYNRLRLGTERAVEQLLFKDRYDYRETLGKLSKAMVSILDLQSLSKKIIETITSTMGVEKASLFLLNEERGSYFLFESKQLTLTNPALGLAKNDPLPRYLVRTRELVIREELKKGAEGKTADGVYQSMSRLGAEVSIPLVSKDALIGVINLSHKFNKDVYSHQDIDLLSMLANQTAIAIENARLYEDLKRSKSYIRRADRLASLGTLTAGLAHEIRNPLVAIKTLTQLLPDRLDDEEFRNHFLQIASGEVDRISSLVNELLEFARPSQPKLEKEDINAVLEGMVLLISTESKKKHIQILKEYTSNLPSITIDREQIKQVFLNCLLNAIEATPENGTVAVKTRSFLRPGGDHYVQIEVADNGCGIPSEHLEDIFTPFFTTKTKGSGLGLSISNQIVQDHQGYIAVESHVDKGSTFFINLPVNQQHPKRRKADHSLEQDHRNTVEQL